MQPLYLVQLCGLVSIVSAVLISNKDKTPVDAATHRGILKYGNFNYAAQLQPCAQAPSGATVIKEFNITSTDTQAALYKLDSEKELILAFPGTATTPDLAIDLFFLPLPFLGVPGCVGCLVHGGFAYAFGSILPSLNATLLEALRDYPDYTLSITGYSLGGGLAKLAFVWARSNSAIAARVGNSWSYGEPRVGNLPFAAYTDQVAGATENDIGLWRRITHNDDGIPALPPLILGFVHSSTEFWEQEDPATGLSSLNTTFRCYGQEPRDCINAHPGLGPNAAHGRYAAFNKAAVCASCQYTGELCA